MWLPVNFRMFCACVYVCVSAMVRVRICNERTYRHAYTWNVKIFIPAVCMYVYVQIHTHGHAYTYTYIYAYT